SPWRAGRRRITRTVPVRKQLSAVCAAIRPGCEVRTVVNGCRKNWSRPKLSPQKYSYSVKSPIAATTMPQTISSRARPHHSASSPRPHSSTLRAALYCIGANIGRTWTNQGLCVYHPNRTTLPNATASSPAASTTRSSLAVGEEHLAVSQSFGIGYVLLAYCADSAHRQSGPWLCQGHWFSTFRRYPRAHARGTC